MLQKLIIRPLIYLENASPTQQSPRLYQQHASLWYDDGSVILNAEGVLFRVHMSVLSVHSRVFADLFKVPQPPSERDNLAYGCPEVHLQDSADDVTSLLKALYDPL